MNRKNPFDFGRVNGRMIAAFAGAVLLLGVCLLGITVSGIVLFSLPPASARPTATTSDVTPSAQPSRAPSATVPSSAATLTATSAATVVAQNVTPTVPAPQGTPTRPTSGQPTSAPATATPAGPGPRPSPTFNWQQAKLPGIPAPIALPMGSPEYGMQAFLWWRADTMDRDISLVRNAGFSWIKQNFGWRDMEPSKGQFDWRKSDRIVLNMNDAGMDLVVRLDFAPDWAAPGCHSDDPAKDLIQGPPKKLQDYADFVTAVATRYRGRIRAYEVWNEPNLAREWCGKAPSAKEYTDMLRIAYTAIKAADPFAWVVSAGLSPTSRNDNVARPDVYYLQDMYSAGASKYFDLLGVHGAGFRASPEADPGEVARNPNLANPGDFAGGVPEELRRVYCFRHAEDLRAVMVKNGDTKKQVALLEFGWTSDTVHPSYAWFAVSEQTKSDYLVRAYKYAYDNWTPWIGLMSLIYISDPTWTKDNEQYWWAITNPDGSPRPAYNALKSMQKPIHPPPQ
ncbi:MAG: beta-galactosidase [Chloroflexi bacterium]|nr:beta-galactosidase [Chloroflexota bacterium]